jgi:hypothetical protein
VLLKVLAREEQGPYPFREVSGNVRQALVGQRFEENLDELVGKLRERSEIVVAEDLLARLGITGTAEEVPEDAPAGHGHH